MRTALHSAPPVAQTPVNRRKPPVTPVDDAFEREADPITDSVVADRFPGKASDIASYSGQGSVHIPPSVARALASPGEPLDASVRSYFEPRFGRDFSGVRLHTDAFAASATRTLNASAYAVGQHIVLGNETSPLLNRSSLPTLAHELTHVVQQRGGGEMHRPRSGRAQETEAGLVANAIAAGGKPAPINQYAAVGLACQPRRDAEEDEIERKRREAISSLDWMADIPSFDPRQEAGETETDRKRREAISSLDWMAGIPPIVFDDDAPTLIRWAERKSQEYYDPESSAEKRAAIAGVLLKVFISLREFEGRAGRDSDGALLYTNRLTEKSTPWTESRVRALDEIPLFGSDSIAEWTLTTKPSKPGAKAGKGRRVSEPPKRGQPAAAAAPPSGLAMNITFHKQSGMTLSSEEGQRRIIAFIIASTRTGFTADQLDWVVAQLGLEKRWAPPPGMDLSAWEASFESIPEGDEVTLTITKSFTFELDRLLSEVPSQRDFLLEGYREGVLEAEAGLKLGIATFAIGTAALGGGALLGTALAPAGAIGSGGLLGGGIGLSARTVATHLYLNAPSLYGQAMLYSGAVLSGASLGQHLLDVRSRGAGWHDISRLAEDLIPFAGGYQDYLTFSGGGTPRYNKPTGDSPDTEIGPPRPPVVTAEPELVITRPPRFDSGSGKVKTSFVDLGSKRTFDGEVDPETGNGQIVDRRSGEVVGVISNGEIRQPSTALPPSGATAAPPATPPTVARPTTPIPSGQTGTTAPASPAAAVSKPPANWRDFQRMASWVQALSRQKHGAAPNMVGMATPGPPFNFASNEAWIWHGLPIRVVNTPTGPRAFYRRDGSGGIRPYGAQIGDWAPFLGFRPTVGGAQLVKPPSAVSPNTPPELYRWGNQEAVDANRWLKAQPQAPAVDVGEEWGIIQRRLEELGVFVEFPIGNVPDVD